MSKYFRCGKYIIHFIFFMLFVFSFADVHSQDTSLMSKYPPDITKIINRKKLIVGIYNVDKPPFVMTDKKGELAGVDVELAKGISKSLGVDVLFDRSVKNYDEFEDRLSKGDFDIVICKYSRTYERAKKVRFSNPYLIFRQGLLVNRRFASKNKIEAYPLTYMKNNNFKIGVREKTSYVEFARQMFPKAEIKEGKWEDLVKKVVSGDLDALLRDEYIIMQLMNKNPDMALYTTMYILKDRKDYLCVAVPYESTNLLSFINIYLESNNIVMDADYLIKQFPNVSGE